MHFVKLRTNGNDHDEDPTHINQFLLPESVQDIQQIIRKLQAVTVTSMEDQDVHNLFMSKVCTVAHILRIWIDMSCVNVMIGSIFS